MNEEQLIAKINALYHKSKQEGLTESEKKQQAELRDIYKQRILGNLRSELDQVKPLKPSKE